MEGSTSSSGKGKKKPQEHYLKYYVHGEIDRDKLVRLRMGDASQPPAPASWRSGAGSQDAAIAAWRARKTYLGIPVACDVNADTGSKEYTVTRLRDFVQSLALEPTVNRCFYEQSFSPDDVPLDDAMVRLTPEEEPFDVRNYLTPVCAHADVEVYFCNNTIKSVADWELREPYYLAYIEQYMLKTGILDDPKNLDLVILDSSNATKVSRHYIWKIKGVMFYSVRDMSAFVRNLESHIMGDKTCGSPERADNLWYMWDEKSRGKMFLLDSIYTDHRCFRFNGNTKKGKNRWLHVHSGSGIEDLVPRSLSTEERNRRELSLDAFLRTTISIPHKDESVEKISLVRVYEPDGITMGRSSSGRTMYGADGRRVRASQSSRVVAGIQNTALRTNGGVARIVKSDAYRLMSQVKWKGAGSIKAALEPGDFSGSKPVFTKALCEDLVRWLFEQTIRDVYGNKVPGKAPFIDASGDEPPAKRLKAAKLPATDIPMGDICGRSIRVYRTSFDASRLSLHCLLMEPAHFCPVMHVEGRRSKAEESRRRGLPLGPGGVYVHGSRPTNLFHEQQNTGFAISLTRRTWWWSCMAQQCKEAMRKRRMEVRIPDCVWDKYAPVIEQLQREMREIFSRNLGEELAHTQHKLAELMVDDVCLL